MQRSSVAISRDTETPRSLARRSTAQSHGYFNGAGGRSAYLRNGGVSRGNIQMKRNLVVLAAVADWNGCMLWPLDTAVATWVVDLASH
jgi:hypothetical protein